MTILILGLVVFLVPHSARIVAPGWRVRMIARYNETIWKILYSLVAAVGLALIVWGYGLARQDPIILYSPPLWASHLTLVLMMPVFVLLAAAYVPGRIKSVVKNPMLASVKLWAVAHLIANGTLADVLLFGSFLVWAVADVISVKRRAGPESVPGLPPAPANDIIALVIGATLYVVFLLFAHQWLFGVSPLA